MLIPYNGSYQLLHGEFESPPLGSVIQVHAIVPDAPVTTTATNLPEIAALINEFQLVFAPPAGYPPPCDCKHTIPLLSGAALVNVRPYHYPPAIKDEIEWQIAGMLDSGVIQHSSSPFSLSVLLVKKKDGSFRFCVDFR